MKVLQLVIRFLFLFVATTALAQDTVSFDDGSQIIGQSFRLDKQTAILTPPVDLFSDSGKNDSITIAGKHVAAVLFGTPSDLKRWKELVDSPRTSDRIVVDRGGSLDFYPGTVLGVTADRVAFRTSSDLTGKTFQLNRSKIVGILFARTGGTLAVEPGETLLLRGGSILHSTLELPGEHDGRYPWRLANGLSGLVSVKAIQSRRSRSGNTIDWGAIVPYLVERPSPVSTVPARTGSPIKDGLAFRVVSGKMELAAPCRIAWNAPSGTNRLQGVVQIPETLDRLSILPKLTFVVRVDGKEIFRDTISKERREIRFAHSGSGMKTVEVELGFERIPIPGALVEFSGTFRTSAPGK